MKIEDFGKTGEGRDLKIVIASKDGVFDPAAIHASGRVILLVQNAIHAGEMDAVLSEITPSAAAYIVIVTRGHQHDMRVLRWALDTPAHYIGMIGSGRKVLTIFQQLEAEGVPRESFQRVYAPIGLEISAAMPEEIAISIVAELIAIRRHCSVALPHSRNRIRKEKAEALP